MRNTTPGTAPQPSYRLPFRTPSGPGEIILHPDQTVQVVVPPDIRVQLEAATHSAQTHALKWGTSLTVGLTALGGILHLRGKRGLAGVAIALGGASGLLARQAKHQAARWPRQAFAPVPVRNVRATRRPDGTLTVTLKLPAPAPPYQLRLSLDEYNPADADAFLRALAPTP